MLVTTPRSRSQWTRFVLEMHQGLQHRSKRSSQNAEEAHRNHQADIWQEHRQVPANPRTSDVKGPIKRQQRR